MLDAAGQPDDRAPLGHLVLGAPHDPGRVCMGSQKKGLIPGSSGNPHDPTGVCEVKGSVTNFSCPPVILVGST